MTMNRLYLGWIHGGEILAVNRENGGAAVEFLPRCLRLMMGRPAITLKPPLNHGGYLLNQVYIKARL